MRRNSQPLVHRPNKMALFLLLLPYLPPPRQLFTCFLTFFPISFSLSSSLCFWKTTDRPILLFLHYQIIPKLVQAVLLYILLVLQMCIAQFYTYAYPPFSANQFSFTSGSENCEEEPDPASRFWDELTHVGLPQDLNVQSLFESGKINRFFLLIFTSHC